MTDIDWKAFRSLVERHERFLLTSHVRPDCDALGSELGMAAVLEALGKQVRIVNADPVPNNLAFIDPDSKIQSLGPDLTPQKLLDDDFQVLMILDTSAWGQLGAMADVVRQTSVPVAILDHHVGEDDFKAELFKNVTAEATGRLVVEAAEQLGVGLTKDAANALFAAVATDTGWFRFNSVTGLTYRIAARLVEAQASPTEIYGELYEQDTLARMHLRGRVLSRIQAERDGQLAYTHVSQTDFAETGAVRTDTEDLVNHLLAIKGTQVALILVEQADGRFKLSFRSRCGFDCSQVAGQFGGGGHRAAAGASMEGNLDAILEEVLPVVRSAMIECGH